MQDETTLLVALTLFLSVAFITVFLMTRWG